MESDLPKVSTHVDQDFSRTNSDIRTESIVKNNITNAEILSDLIDFEDRLKTHYHLNELMRLSASVPSGYDLNCIELD